MNHKRFRRLYREEKLHVRRCVGRKPALGVRAPLQLPSGPNERWSLDFVSDCFTDGHRFRILAVVDDFTHESLALIPDTIPDPGGCINVPKLLEDPRCLDWVALTWATKEGFSRQPAQEFPRGLAAHPAQRPGRLAPTFPLWCPKSGRPHVSAKKQ